MDAVVVRLFVTLLMCICSFEMLFYVSSYKSRDSRFARVQYIGMRHGMFTDNE